MKLVAAACLALALAAPVAAQGLPASVSEPYRAYQTAMEAGDEAAALDPAYRAWQAAEAAGVDAETTGLLADNYAALASAAGQHEQAAAAFARSAEILADTEGGTLLTAQTWRLSAEQYFRGDDENLARRMADRALAILQRLPATREAAAERYRTETVLAYAEYERGRIRQTAPHARNALDALGLVGPISNMDTANMAFFAGIGAAIDYESPDSAFYFTLASYMYAAAGADVDTRRVAEAWARYGRSELDEDERIALFRRLRETEYRPPECENPDDCDLTVGEGLNFPPEAEVIDASPISRREPRYPLEMAQRGLQGVALVMFSIDEDGRPFDIEAIYSVPHPDFGEVSVEAVERWRYTPLLVDGEPTPREGIVTQFIFQLPD